MSGKVYKINKAAYGVIGPKTKKWYKKATARLRRRMEKAGRTPGPLRHLTRFWVD